MLSILYNYALIHNILKKFITKGAGSVVDSVSNWQADWPGLIRADATGLTYLLSKPKDINFMQMILKFIYHYPLQMQVVLYSSLELLLMTFFAG